MPSHTAKEQKKNRDLATVNNVASRLAGTAPDPLVSDTEIRRNLREELRRKERGL